MNDQCGWMCEGGGMQCIYPAGHPEKVHKWGPLPAWACAYHEDDTSDQEGAQEVPQVLGDRGLEIQGQEERIEVLQ